MAVELDIPCDVQGRDGDGRLWAFLKEAAHPEAVAVGRIVVTGDECDRLWPESSTSSSDQAVPR